MGSADWQSFAGVYDLIGVIARIGRDSKFGHYMTYAKAQDNLWLRWEDQKVTAHRDKHIFDDLSEIPADSIWTHAFASTLLYKARKS